MLQRHRFVPFLRSLESRLAPATFTVQNLLNAGPDSLRNCIQSANANAGADTVNFAPGLIGTIMLTGGDIAVSEAVSILGPGAKSITVDGTGVGRIFTTQNAVAGAVIVVSGLTLTGGNAAGGGAILVSDEDLNIVDCTISGNTSTGGGGGIVITDNGRLFIFNSTLSGNSAKGDGGAASVVGGGSEIYVYNSTLSGNTADGDGGGLYSNVAGSNDTFIYNSTITGNLAVRGGGFAVNPANAAIVTIDSCIVAKNTAPTGTDLFASSITSIAVFDSAIGNKMGVDGFLGDATTTSLLGQNFKLGALADNGGNVQTHKPANDSPVRDQAVNISGSTYDNRGIGFPREINARVDCGAIECDPLFIVRNDGTSGTDSLRQQVLDANVFVGANTITFDAVAFAATDDTITLTSGGLAVTEALTIVGPGARLATVSGDDVYRVFDFTGATANSILAISGLTIEHGAATSGGAFLLGNHDLVITDCTVRNNVTTVADGGAIHINAAGADVTIRNSTFTGNVSKMRGGAIAFFPAGGGLLIENSTLVGNTASTGGAISLDGVYPGFTIRNSTIVGNTATTVGNGTGGIRVASASPFDVELDSSIVAGNVGNSFPDFSTNVQVTANFSAIGSAAGIGTFVPDATTTALLGQTFKLGSLANNGGPTDTILPLAGSPLISAGSNPASLANDQRGGGFGRQRGAGIDIGAVEYPSNFVVTNTLSTGPGSLRQAVTDADAFAGYDQINFDPTVFKSANTITLGSVIDIDDTVSINGPGATLLTINAANVDRVFNTTGVPTGGKVVISSLTLTNGSAFGSGGAIYIDDELVFIDQCRIAGNTALNGGAIFVANGQVFVSNTSIANNKATVSGGGIYQSAGDLTLTANTLSGNTANNGGGGGLQFVGAGDLLVSNSTFSGNTAPGNGQSGGGISLSNVTGNIGIYNSTLTLNAASGPGGSGGGIARISGTSTIFIDSTILSNNTATTGPDCYTTGVLDAGFSLLGTAAGIGFPVGDAKSTSLLGQAAKLGPLADLGGPTMTHYLLPGSPAISNGSNLLGLPDDQRGKPRTVGTIDIGAVELAPAHVASVVVGDGSAQRSVVTQIIVTFDDAVTFVGAPASAFTVVRSTPLPIAGVTLAAAVDNSGPTTVVTLTFIGGSVDGKSLADGRYNLNVLSGQFAGEGFDGNGDGIAGDDYGIIGDTTVAPKLFRFFGDADGDGAVAANDFIQFRLALGGNNPIFDFDGDGAVAASDFIQFRLRFGGSI